MTPTEALAPPTDISPDTTDYQPQEGMYGPENEDLPEQLVNALKSAVIHFQKQEEYLRRREVRRDARNRFYERGYQHIRWDQTQGGYVMVAAGANVAGLGGGSIQAPNYIDDYNLTQRFLQIVQAMLTQNPPDIDFQAKDPNRISDVDAANTADKYRHIWDRNNDRHSIQSKIVRMFGVSSKCAVWTRTEANAQKYGLNPDGTPKRVEITTVHGSLETRTPILEKCQDDFLFLGIYQDKDVRKAKADAPEKFRPQIKEGTSGLGENQYERYARLGVLQGARGDTATGQAFAHLVTCLYWWMRPEAFTGKEYDDPLTAPDEGDWIEDEAGQRPMTVGEKLHQMFPEGVRVEFAGDVYIGSRAESMDDAVVVGHPYQGDGQFRMAILDPFIVVQDAFNDAMNATREIFDVGWPSRWVSCEDQEYDAVRSQRASPFAIRQLKVPSGNKLQDSHYEEKNPELPATFVNYIETLQGPLPQFMLATPPALFGEAMQDQKTASGYAQARSQAMGQLGIIWGEMQRMFARIYFQAALLAAKNPDNMDPVTVSVEGATAELQLSTMTKGSFGAFPAQDSSMPETTVAKRETMTQLLTLLQGTPLQIQLMSAPDNIRTMLDQYGMTDIVVPEAEAAEQQQHEIELLLVGAPIPPEPEVVEDALVDHAAQTMDDQAMGLEPPADVDPMEVAMNAAQPSVPINEYDYHEFHAKKCQDWLNGSECRRQLQNGNQIGVQNVILHWKAHLAVIAEQQAAAAMAAAALNPQPAEGGGPAKKPPKSEETKIKDQPPGSPGVPTM